MATHDGSPHCASRGAAGLDITVHESDVRRRSVHLAPELPVSLKAIFEAAQTAALPACLTTTTIYSSHSDSVPTAPRSRFCAAPTTRCALGGDALTRPDHLA
ncbi:MAG TPA: hypothetical protein VES79_01160 [Solirubrobacteraceae bacterium]|nr:hypothetical protein [Solirubrobacteraceae bacterium]